MFRADFLEVVDFKFYYNVNMQVLKQDIACSKLAQYFQVTSVR